jgi:hypothetical protein
MWSEIKFQEGLKHKFEGTWKGLVFACLPFNRCADTPSVWRAYWFYVDFRSTWPLFCCNHDYPYNKPQVTRCIRCDAYVIISPPPSLLISHSLALSMTHISGALRESLWYKYTVEFEKWLHVNRKFLMTTKKLIGNRYLCSYLFVRFHTLNKFKITSFIYRALHTILKNVWNTNSRT